ncbi:hypothetical protein [Paenibacillus sp. KS-LC4]|uniref:hypothetical protein n=1 Tax=Paenibacillus sp. KS-LC4 TaxID=2979727 RepID=UPI0030D1A323
MCKLSNPILTSDDLAWHAVRDTFPNWSLNGWHATFIFAVCRMLDSLLGIVLTGKAFRGQAPQRLIDFLFFFAHLALKGFAMPSFKLAGMNRDKT